MNKPFVKEVHIGVDLMGSETDPKEIMLACVNLLSNFSKPFSLHFFGSFEVAKYYKSNYSTIDHCHFHACKSSIFMEDSPLSPIREKKDSSLSQALFALKEKKIDALISCANTGALLSASKIFLSTLENVSRPALCVFIPTRKSPVAVLDVGANVSAKEHHLLQFALMGSAYQKVLGIPYPKVALLNIGREDFKGGAFLQKCYKMLQNQKKRFVFLGNVEPKSVFSGDLDVLITDGFSGNIFLKTAETAFAFCLDLLQKDPRSEELKFFSNSPYYLPGALLLGAKGIVIKCHGDAETSKITRSIESAIGLIEKKLIEKLGSFLTTI